MTIRQWKCRHGFHTYLYESSDNYRSHEVSSYQSWSTCKWHGKCVGCGLKTSIELETPLKRKYLRRAA